MDTHRTADPGAPALAAPAGLPADAPRAAVCLALPDRRAWTGAELCRLVLERGWARRVGTGRAVRTTPLGEREPARTPGIPAATPRPG